MSSGKGDVNRPKSITYEQWSDNYEKIFRKETNKEEEAEKENE
jgi:hypothetical protein|tara:strand:+ start:67 stop:195 length:129 start_codon:yes stop_codon:yes gene_type:complete